MSASPCSWTASTSPAGGAGCSIEPLSEMATLGGCGLVLMLALAVPAFRETSDEDWLKKSELAVTFLDRYGNEIGSRGIRHNDSIPLDEFPGPPDQGDAGDRGPPLLRAFRHRRSGPVPRGADQCARRRRGAGRLLDHAATGQEPVPVERAHHRAQGQRGLPVASGWNRGCPRTRSSSSISTAPIWAAAPSGSTRRRSIISTSRRAT